MADKKTAKKVPYFYGVRFESKDDFERVKRSYVKEMNFKDKSFSFSSFLTGAIIKETNRVWKREDK